MEKQIFMLILIVGSLYLILDNFVGNQYIDKAAAMVWGAG